MRTTQEKRDFALSTIQPMAEHTFRYVSQVLGVRDERKGESRGSAVFCMIDGRQAVVTAAHVLREIARDEKFVNLAFTRGENLAPGISAGQIRYADHEDVAVYLPDRELPLGLDRSFWPEERIDPTSDFASTDYLFVQGYPRFKGRLTTLGGHALVSESFAYGAMVRSSLADLDNGSLTGTAESDLLPSGFLGPHQFAFHFSADQSVFLDPKGLTAEQQDRAVQDWSDIFLTGEGETFPGQRTRGPYGLSGSPVWRIGANGLPGESWTPQRSRLLGIVTHWNIDHGVLIATSISQAIELALRD